MRRNPLLISLVIALLVLLASPAALAADASPSPAASDVEVVYRIGLLKDYDTFNPLMTISSLGFALTYAQYDFLTRYDVDYNVAPQLATDWVASEDGLTWTFTIREGVRWSDGEPLTAADIAFTYDLIIAEQNPNYLFYLDEVSEVTAPDDVTLVITTATPSVRMLNLMIPILPEHVWGGLSSNELASFENLPSVTSGPFRVVEAKTGNFVRLEPNPYYWGGELAIDEILYVIYKTSEPMVEDYVQGRLDVVIEPESVSVPKLEALAGTTLTTAPGFSWNGIGFNCRGTGPWKDNPLADVRLRQAIHWALDKEAIAETCMLGYATVATSVVPAWSSWHWSPSDDARVTYDPAKAEEMLDAAGYIDRDGDGVREREDGTPLDLRFAAPSEYGYASTEAKLVAGYLDKVGIKVRIEGMTENTMYQKVYEGDIDMYSTGWYSEPDPAFVLGVVTVGSSGGFNDTGYENPEYDRIFREQIAAIDPAERAPLIAQLQQIVYEEAPYIPLWYDPATQAWRSDRFTGWVQAPRGGGVEYNYLQDTAVNLKPGTAVVDGDDGSGRIATIVPIVVGLVVAVAAVVLVLRRRRGRALEE